MAHAGERFSRSAVRAVGIIIILLLVISHLTSKWVREDMISIHAMHQQKTWPEVQIAKYIQ